MANVVYQDPGRWGVLGEKVSRAFGGAFEKGYNQTLKEAYMKQGINAVMEAIQRGERSPVQWMSSLQKTGNPLSIQAGMQMIKSIAPMMKPSIVPGGARMADPYTGEPMGPEPEPETKEVEYYDSEGNLRRQLVPENELQTFYDNLHERGYKLKEQDKIQMVYPGRAPRKVVPGSKAHMSMLEKGWREVGLEDTEGGPDYAELRRKIKYEAEQAMLQGRATPEQERLLGLDDQYLNAALRILQPEMMMQPNKPTSYWTRRVGELADTLKHQMDIEKGRGRPDIEEYIFSPGKGLIRK